MRLRGIGFAYAAMVSFCFPIMFHHYFPSLFSIIIFHHYFLIITYHYMLLHVITYYYTLLHIIPYHYVDFLLHIIPYHYVDFPSCPIIFILNVIQTSQKTTLGRCRLRLDSTRFSTFRATAQRLRFRGGLRDQG